MIRDGQEDLAVEVDWIRFRRVVPSEAALRFQAERHLHWGDHRISNEELAQWLPVLLEAER